MTSANISQSLNQVQNVAPSWVGYHIYLVVRDTCFPLIQRESKTIHLSFGLPRESPSGQSVMTAVCCSYGSQNAVGLREKSAEVQSLLQCFFSQHCSVSSSATQHLIQGNLQIEMQRCCFNCTFLFAVYQSEFG